MHPSIQSISFQFGKKNVLRDCVKSLSEVQIDDISDSDAVRPSEKVTRLVG